MNSEIILSNSYNYPIVPDSRRRASDKYYQNSTFNLIEQTYNYSANISTNNLTPIILQCIEGNVNKGIINVNFDIAVTVNESNEKGGSLSIATVLNVGGKKE